MVNLQQFLLSLLPVIDDQPAPVFLAPAFAAAVSDDGGIDNFFACHLYCRRKTAA
jgi:hypothetical protein